MTRNRRGRRADKPSLEVLVGDLAVKYAYMVFLVAAILVVLYPVRGLLHINYVVIWNAFPYFASFPLFIMIVVGALYEGRGEAS